MLAVWAVAKGGEKIVGFPVGMGPIVDGILAAITIGAIVFLLASFARRKLA